MCWSGEASFALSAAGLGATAYLIKSKEEKVLWIPLLYFTAMELLQGFNYFWIGECGLPQNQIFALLGYVHIMFQSFFCNAVALYFIPKQVRDNIAGYVYAACLLVPFVFIHKLYPFDWAGACPVGKEPLCGVSLCGLRGEWHIIAWELPLNGILSYWLPDMTGPVATRLGFPIVFGGIHSIAYSLTVFASLLTSNINEIPAVWCLFSIGICCSVIKSPLITHLYVRKWFFYPQTRC
jgi:hypothetical protein